MELLIRADDLGFSEAVNLGIAKTVHEGIIRNVGLMTNMPYSRHGYDLIKDAEVCLGQHTNISTGKPILDPEMESWLKEQHMDYYLKALKGER